MAISPLRPDIRIAMPDGRPTIEFMRLWEELRQATNGATGSFDTATQTLQLELLDGRITSVETS